MRLLLYICRVLVGSLFIVSGLIKANDTLGFSYKLQEYFEPGVLGWTWLEPYALPIAMLICVGEVVLGVAVVLGGRMRISAWFLLGLILFFTWLTFYSAYFDKVTDCGCFGDAIKLTPWQSFSKDVVLLVLIVPIFLFRRRITFNTLQEDLGMMGASLVLIALFAFGMLGWGFPVMFTAVVYGLALAVKQLMKHTRSEWIVGGVATLACVLFVHRTYAHLPLKDFRPYAIGKSIPEEMKVPEGMEGDIYETRLTYRNKGTGEVKDFSQSDYPWDDPEWEWVSTDNTLVKKGYTPPIHDLQFLDEDGVDNTASILEEASPILLVIAKNTEDTDASVLPAIKALADAAFRKGWYVYGLTASPYEHSEDLRHRYQLPFDFLQCDETTLKTIVRSNPGILLLQQGVVRGKWHANDVPTLADAELQVAS
ncbi:MAG: DoxX family membrane protein [Flavobacteriales bacterium]|nr:DoxX family membrane protein [Flavobacteriales bacterium]MCB9168062.1 DoxX family membrane protein [Flavobacteriales bacterium]